VLTLFLFGVAPAFATARIDLQQALRSTAGSVGGGHSRLLNLLVIGEVALVLVLLTAAGLLARSFANVAGIDTGFQPAQVLTFDVSLTKPRYVTPPQRDAFLVETRARLRAMPAVVDAGYVSSLPLARTPILGGPVEIEHYSGPSSQQRPFAGRLIAGPGYFEALEIPRLKGRTFTDADNADAPRVAVINRAFAKQGWGTASPIGSRIRFVFGEKPTEWLEVVGVVADVHYAGPESDVATAVYLASAQDPSASEMSFVVRTRGLAEDLTAPIRQAIQALDPTLPLYNVRTMTALYDEAVASRRFAAVLVSVFAGAGLALVAIGLFGVMSYLVGLRTKEIGLRLALGSQRSAVRRLVLREALRMTAIGTLIGFVASIALGRVLAAFVYGIRPSDPTTLLAAAFLLAGVTAMAAYAPARRASSLDPLEALRTE
jgi:putative ABC transport system permease protein